MRTDAVYVIVSGMGELGARYWFSKKSDASLFMAAARKMYMYPHHTVGCVICIGCNNSFDSSYRGPMWVIWDTDDVTYEWYASSHTAHYPGSESNSIKLPHYP